MALRTLALFDGYGGFELGFRLAGIRTVVVARVERDSHAAATLVARMEETHLDQAPIWDDVTSFDGRPWAGRVDLITAGFNCQPFSSAGQRRGVDDERWLWGDIARIVADVGPRYVFLENVPGLVRLGLPHILVDLACLGFDAEWGCLSAAAVGAPHRRNRWWLLAWHVGDADGSRRPEDAGGASGDESSDGWGAHGADIAHGPSEDVADADSQRGLPSQRPRPTRPNRRPQPDTSGAWPPPPDDHTAWQHWTANGGPQPTIRRRAHGRPLGLAESLHAGGNGLVPRVAAAAFVELERRMTDGSPTT